MISKGKLRQNDTPHDGAGEEASKVEIRKKKKEYSITVILKQNCNKWR